MYQQIISLVQNNRLSEARSLCEQLCRSNKNDTQAWLMLAEINERSGSLNKAESNYLKVIKLKKDFAPAHTRLGMIYHSQGKLNKAKTHYQRSLALDSNQASIHFNLGAILQETGETAAAVKAYTQAIKLKPDYAKAYANMGFILRREGNIEEAVASYQKALQFEPNIPDIYYNLALSLIDSGDSDTAESHLKRALEINPAYTDALMILGTLQIRNNEPEAAIESYEQILASDPGNVDASIAIGFQHLALGQHDEASRHCETVLANDAGNENAVCLAANICEKQGDAQTAYEHLAPLIDKQSPRLEAVLCFLSIGRSLDKLDAAIAYAEHFLETNATIDTNDRMNLFFAMGKAYDLQQSFDKAFHYYDKANKMKQVDFDVTDVSRVVDGQMKTFTPGFSDTLPTSTIDDPRPVFIVGMPRSGTSLVEQILDTHPEIAGAGELQDINKAVTEAMERTGSKRNYPDCVQGLTSNDMDELARAYLDKLSSISSDAERVTDKLPSNFLHLGLIQCLFPQAHIIHCMRDPQDTALSCYFNDFGPTHPWIYDLEHIGQFYLQYLTLMDHWKQVLKLPVLDVQYEDLVSDQARVSREMIEFCGLQWDESCMDFHNNERFVWTASYDQVRKPMYKDSVERWKHYEAHLSPLRQTLKLD